MMRRCGFLRRRWHRRLREADVKYLLPALQQRAEVAAARRPDLPLVGEAHDQFVQARVDEAMLLHTLLPGEEHWRCPCAQADRARVR